MADEWFYAEDGETVGPVSVEALARRIELAGDEPHFVWAPGMPQWVDARTLPQFAARSARPARAVASTGAPAQKAAQPAKPREAAQPAKPRGKLVERARHEFISYLAVSAYLLIWFVALLFYKSTILRSVGVEFAPFGVAVVKALILGKFIVVLEAVKLGEREGSEAILIVQIVTRALIFTVALVIISILEEVVVGHFHGRSLSQSLSEIGGGSLLQLLANALLMFLVLVPYLAFRKLALQFGELPEFLFTRRRLERLPNG